MKKVLDWAKETHTDMDLFSNELLRIRLGKALKALVNAVDSLEYVSGCNMLVDCPSHWSDAKQTLIDIDRILGEPDAD